MAGGLDLSDEGLLSVKVSVPVDVIAMQFNFFRYSRAPNSEAKPFAYPSFDLTPPKIEIIKMAVRLTPLASFLDQNKTSFTYLSDHSKIKFTLPFSSSISYKLPLATAKVLDFKLHPINKKRISLLFEQELEFIVEAPKCKLHNLDLVPSPADSKTFYKLSDIHWIYKTPLKQLIYPKSKSLLSPSLNDYFPPCSSNQLEFNTQKTQNKPVSISPEAKQKLFIPNENDVLTKIALTEPERSFSKIFYGPQSFSYFFLSTPLLLAKHHFPIFCAIDFPNLKEVSPTATYNLKKFSGLERSPTTNLFSSAFATNSLVSPNIQTENYLKVTYLLNYMPEHLTYKYDRNLFFEIPKKTVIERKCSTNIFSPPIYSYDLKMRDEKKNFPKIITNSFAFQPSKKIVSPKFENQSVKEKYNSHFIAPIAFTISPVSLIRDKECLTYLSSTEIPSPFLHEKNLNKTHLIRSKSPTKNSYNTLYSSINQFDLKKIKLTETSQLVTASIKKSLTKLDPTAFALSSKVHLDTFILAWSFPKLNKTNTPLLPLLKNTSFAFSRESCNLNCLNSTKTVRLAHQPMKQFSLQGIELCKITKALVQPISVPIFAKRFIPYNLNDNILEVLFALYADKVPPIMQTIFNNPEIILARFQDALSEKISHHCLDKVCSLAFPQKTTYQIPLSQSSSFLNKLLDDQLAFLEWTVHQKEGIFPNTQFLSAGTLETSLEFDTYKPLAATYKEEIALSVTTDICVEKTNLKSSLIEIQEIENLLIPPIPFNELMLSLHPVTEFSSFSFIKEEAVMQNRRSRHVLENLAEMPSLEFLQTYSLGDEFKVDAHVLSKMDRTGYVFSLQVSPYDRECVAPIPNHVYFILDKSASIEKHRFEAFKDGVIQSLNHIGKETSFNIITFDQTYANLSITELAPTKSSIQYVKKSLEKVTQKTTSSFSTLISAIEEIQAKANISNEPHTVILLSNGHFLKNFRINRESFYKIFHAPSDNFSIFTAAISDNNNDFMLESLAKLGRGEFLYSQTHSAFPRKLSLLVKRLQKPIATDFSIYCMDPNQKITFAQDPLSSPLFFGSRPYTIYGVAEKLENLKFIIQAKSGDKWINIVKEIDLSRAEKGKTIDKELASKMALSHLLNFIFKNDQKELLHAKELIKPFDLKWPLT